MGLFDLTDLVLQRGLQGASLRQQLLSNNLANANTAGFKRSDVDFESALGAALGSNDPGHPDADAQGYVTLPNVNTVTEMTDLITESRGYEADTKALEAAKTMYTKTLDLLR